MKTDAFVLRIPLWLIGAFIRGLVVGIAMSIGGATGGAARCWEVAFWAWVAFDVFKPFLGRMAPL